MLIAFIFIIMMIATESIATASVYFSAISRVAEANIQWGPCSNPILSAAGGECGFLAVPLDYANPDGIRIKLAISRIKHKVSDNKFQGIMLVNPGGPGSPGTWFATTGSTLPKAASEAYDWIGFDPRGIGDSEPAIYCISDHENGPAPNQIPWDQKVENIWLQRSQTYAMACSKNNSQLLKHMTTIDTVNDIESIRIALLQDQINFYGVSYGSYLGQVYSTMFPNRVRRMILDAVADPRSVWFKLNLEQNAGLDRNTKLWFRWMAKYNSFYQLGKTGHEVGKRWNYILKQLETDPINGTIGPVEWINIFLQVTYTQASWPLFATCFARWANEKNFEWLLALHLLSKMLNRENKYAGYLSVMCTDAKWPRSWKHVRRENWHSFVNAPMFTWYNAWHNAPCQYWSEKGGQPINVDGRNVSDILLIGETLDAPTPFKGSLEVRRRFPRARLLVKLGGTSHGDSLDSNKCVIDLVTKYLQTGTLPRRKFDDLPDVSCPPSPEPIPSTIHAFMSENINALLSQRFFW